MIFVQCPSCGRFEGFHARDCAVQSETFAMEASQPTQIPPDDLSAIELKLEALLGDVGLWSSRRLSPWAMQLVHDVDKALGTARWLAHDVERRIADAAALADARRNGAAK